MTAASRVVLDSWPIVEAAKGSKNAISAIGSLLSEQVPIMSAINYAEAYSAVFVRQGVWEARDTVELLRQVVELDIPDFERIMQAAHLKSAYYLALGDSFAAATALHHEAELWTGDSELLFDGSPWRTRDLRENRPITSKQRAGKVGRRARAETRPPHEPEILLVDLMRFLDGSLDKHDLRQR